MIGEAAGGFKNVTGMIGQVWELVEMGHAGFLHELLRVTDMKELPGLHLTEGMHNFVSLGPKPFWVLGKLLVSSIVNESVSQLFGK